MMFYTSVFTFAPITVAIAALSLCACSGTYTVGDGAGSGAAAASGGAGQSAQASAGGGSLGLGEGGVAHGGPLPSQPVPTNPLLLPSKGTQWGCLNCEWKLTARGYENYVPLSTHENPEAYFVWSYNSPNDLNGSVFTLTVVNPNNGVVVVKPFALSRGVDRLFWGDGGDVDIGAGVTKTVGCNISLPAWSVDGYDPARIVRIGLAMKPQDGSIGESGTATVIIRSWHFDPME